MGEVLGAPHAGKLITEAGVRLRLRLNHGPLVGLHPDLHVHSLDAILKPRSIAVVGASRRPGSIGWQILHNLLRHGFTGPVYPINPAASAIHSIRAYPTLADLPEVPDLAIVTVPASAVPDVARQCVEVGVKGMVVITAGFKEVGGEGLAREAELLEILEGSGIRLVGPNCMGVINTSAETSMDATFAPAMPPPGPVAFMSQSGALGLSILDYAESLGIGLSMFVSVGNKADVSGNALLEYWAEDENTKLVLMYLENFGHPVRFVELARRITRRKPILIVKSGRTGAGRRAAASHTGALAQTDLATEAIVRQGGAIRVDTVHDLFNLAMAFSNQPLPEGNRVAVVTNAGGPGIIIADACEVSGLEVVALADETRQRLKTRLPEEASVRNPVDLIASANAESYRFALECVLEDPSVDAAIAAFVPPLGIQTQKVAEAIVAANERFKQKPILGVLMGRQGLPAGIAELHEANIPAYTFPESAARALGAMWRYAERRERPQGSPVSFDVDDEAVVAILDRATADGITKLSEPDVLGVLEAYGIQTVPWAFVPVAGAPRAGEAKSGKAKSGRASSGQASSGGPNSSEPVTDEAREPAIARATAAAEALGLPVALKLVSPQVVHKTDVGGVRLDLDTADSVRSAVTEMGSRAESIEADIQGFLLQRMAPRGRETIVGLTRMPGAGPMVMFGLGGVYVEVLRDVVLRLCPLLDTDAREMVREVRMAQLLEGVRGEAPRDLEALAEVILRVGQLAERHPRITEMDLNPVLALEQGCLALDARISLGG